MNVFCRRSWFPSKLDPGRDRNGSRREQVKIALGKRSAPQGTRCTLDAPPWRGGTNPAHALRSSSMRLPAVLANEKAGRTTEGLR